MKIINIVRLFKCDEGEKQKGKGKIITLFVAKNYGTTKPEILSELL